jgi:hypothetical protein
MTQRDREFGQFLRLSLHAAAESVAVGDDGLDRIRSRLAELRRAAAPGRGEPSVRGTARTRLVLAGVSAVDPEYR